MFFLNIQNLVCKSSKGDSNFLYAFFLLHAYINLLFLNSYVPKFLVYTTSQFPILVYVLHNYDKTDEVLPAFCFLRCQVRVLISFGEFSDACDKSPSYIQKKTINTQTVCYVGSLLQLLFVNWSHYIVHSYFTLGTTIFLVGKFCNIPEAFLSLCPKYELFYLFLLSHLK